MKKAFVMSLASMCIVLSGCSGVQNSLEQKLTADMREKSNISTDAGYAQFEEFTAQGKVVDGYYAPNGDAVSLLEQNGEEVHNGIKVSFSSNSHLNVRYYYDSDFSTEMDSNGCTLSPGSSIYAKVKNDGSVTTNQYGFSSFQIYEYSDDGKRTPIAEVPLGEDGLVWSIPEDFEGVDVVIEPFGKYENRVLSFQDYYTDSKSKKIELDNTWTVDGRSTKDGTIEVSPVRPYSVRYEYDSDKYFFVSSVPDYYSYNDDEGTVYFKKVEPNEDITAFSVELKPYMQDTIRVDVKADVTQGDQKTTIKKNEPYVADRLKYGDKITIQTESDCKIEYNKNLFDLQADQDQHCYTLTVYENQGDFLFDPSEYSYDHGEIVFKYAGEPITGKILLGKGRQITYSAENLDDGYWCPEGTIVVGNAAETKAQINQIRISPKQEATVILPQPEYGGSITYSINGVNLTGNSVKTFYGTTIQMKLKAWDGWEVKSDATVDYNVKDESAPQEAKINDVDVNHVFEELPRHKPTLKVELHKSVGPYMTFNIAAAGIDEDANEAVAYSKGGITGYQNVCEKTIGTAQGITIKAQHESLQGKVLKFFVKLVDDQKNETYRVYYMEQLSNPLVIPIYQAKEIANAKSWYKTIDVTISVVDKQVYQPAPVANGVVVLTAMDVENQPRLQAGDILDDDRDVRVVLKANSGYYVTGSKVKFDQYQNDMSFEDYRKDIQSIVNKHPVKKIFTVTLDGTDAYGTVEYTLDGTPVSGKISLREGQKLVMKYHVQSPGYQIERNTEGFTGLFNKKIASKTDESVTIEISSALDGQTIRRSDYVQIRKEG